MHARAALTALLVASSSLDCALAVSDEYTLDPAFDEGGGGAVPAASCSDGQRSGRETDVDCGGSCSPCADDRACAAPTDCQSGVCDGGKCKTLCHDGVQNGDETDVDCGGHCIGCPHDGACNTDSDCAQGHCKAHECKD